MPLPSSFSFFLQCIHHNTYIAIYIHIYMKLLLFLTAQHAIHTLVLFSTSSMSWKLTLHEFIGLFLILRTPVYGCAKLYSTSFSWMTIKLFPMFCYNSNATVIKNPSLLFCTCTGLEKIPRTRISQVKGPIQMESFVVPPRFLEQALAPTLRATTCPRSMCETCSPRDAVGMPVTSGPHSPAPPGVPQLWCSVSRSLTAAHLQHLCLHPHPEVDAGVH